VSGAGLCMDKLYSTDYFRRRRMGQALATPFDLQSPALKAYRRAARMLMVQPGMRILDAGCGLGAGSWLLAMLGAHVTGVDVSADGVAWARQTYGAQPLRKGGTLQYLTADLTTWIPPDRYDAIIVADVLEHFPRATGVGMLRRLLAALVATEQPPTRGWVDGLFLHLPITANLIDWALLLKNRLLLRRLRGEIIDHHGDTTHVLRYGLLDVPQLAREAGGQICRVELRIYKPRLRTVERLLLGGNHRTLTRIGGTVITDLDAILLPELVAALRAAPPDDESTRAPEG
jgi:SAM-dependent methyltransferase